jgi:hypothetical protein
MPDLATMRAAVLREADLINGQVDDADVNALLNEECAALYELIVDAHEGMYSTTATPVVVASPTDSIALPADFYRATDLEDVTNLAAPYSLPTFEFKDRNSPPRGRGWCVHAGSILLRPSATAPATYRFTYVPAFTALVLDADLFTVPNQWQIYAILGCAIRLRNMQELSASGLEDRRKDVLVRIQNATSKRKGPHKARDVRGTRSRARRPGDDTGYP